MESRTEEDELADRGISPSEGFSGLGGVGSGASAASRSQNGAQSFAHSRTASMARVALCIAIIAVSAWITVPIGPVPFTLQPFAVTFAIVALRPKECLCALGGYVLLGAAGLPVFSGMRGGIGVLLGPTGGYIWGYVIGGACAAAVLVAMRRFLKVPVRDGLPLLRVPGASSRNTLASLVAVAAYLVVSYLCGWAQFMLVSGTGPVEAFLVSVAPFIALDLVKVIAAALCAQAVLRA